MEKLCLTWEKPYAVGAGLSNVGNSCYLNAALQCLTYTPPLANYLLSRENTHTCLAKKPCLLCTMGAHVARALHQPGHVIQPAQALGAGFHRHRQEDAHEFLVFFLDAMQKACLFGHQECHTQSRDSDLVCQIFGGCWRSQIECLHCHSLSDTLDPYMDIAIDIQSARSVTEALEQMVKPERLEGENAYHCSACQRTVSASKTLMLHTSSKVLMLVLKRFSDFTGDKIAKDVQYPESLDMQPYACEQNGRPLTYSLYAVLVHAGLSCHRGHYFAYVKAGNSQWYQMDDAKVRACDLASVLCQPAYILFYVQKSECDSVSGTVSYGSDPPALGAELDTHMDAVEAESKPDSHIHVGDLEQQEEDWENGGLTLDEWKFLQEQNRPKSQFHLRTVESALPSSAVLIHQSKHRGEMETNHRVPEGCSRVQSRGSVRGQLCVNTGQDLRMGEKARASKRKKKQGKKSMVLFSVSLSQG